MSEGLRSTLEKRIRAEGPLPFVDFCRMALYDPDHGYYSGERKRVGADRQSDFVTNLAVRSVFAPLIVESIRTLCDSESEKFRFVEIGAEPGISLLEGIPHSFRSVEVVRLGESFPAPDGPTVVFANEWLDARPFVRLSFREGTWRESMVSLDESGNFAETFAPTGTSPDARDLIALLPGKMPEGYRLDLSLEAERRLDEVLQGEWPEVFLTFDYGSRWDAMLHHLPGGTARSYRNQRQSDDLLQYPGEQDLTCNVCWDRVSEVCRRNGFSVFGPERQEAFLFKHAGNAIRQIVEGGQNGEDAERRMRLQQILHPAHFGAAFQAFWAVRRPVG